MSIRQEKVSRLIQKELGEIFQRESKSQFGGAMITVTMVRITPDLGYAKVYLSIFVPGNDLKAIFKLIKEKTSLTRGMLGKKVGKQLRIIPELAFFIDDSLDYAENIDNLLKK